MPMLSIYFSINGLFIDAVSSSVGIVRSWTKTTEFFVSSSDYIYSYIIGSVIKI
jgi:hypothetical protein